MKAFLLAGGRGERLRPLTLTVPKCLAPINGTPLLAIWLDRLGRQGVTDVLLNVSHHADQVRSFLSHRGPGGPRVELVVEDEPLGSAGTVAANRGFVGDAADFWVFYADNLTTVDLVPMLAAHRRHAGLMTIGVFRAPDPRAAGIVSLAEDGRVVEFVEKPERPRGNLANAGIYLARAALLGRLQPDGGILDFGHHVLPGLIGTLYGFELDGFLMDIGTPAALQAAEAAWSRLEARELDT